MKLALGSVQFGLDYGIANQGGQVSQDEVKLILNHACAHGMNTIDTAINYGNCEQRLGEIGMPSGWQVISKLPALPEHCQNVEAWVHSEVLASLDRLRIPRLRGLLLHRPEQLLGSHGKKIHQALLELKQQGLVEKVGVSIYDPAELDLLTQCFPLDIVQAPFNILDRRLITSGWMDRLSKMNIELHTRSVFLQGLLLMPGMKRPDTFNRWQPLWQNWEQWLSEIGLTPLQACLRDALAQTGIARVVVGVDSLLQIKEILLAAEGSTPELPESLCCNDIDLINPAHWNNL
jgi:aryl-alcohol dehydrogenase-like predicted oxidoreductase